MLNFYELWRPEDITGVSGTGKVAIASEDTLSGKCLLAWRGGKSSAVIYKNIELLRQVHCSHGGSYLEQIEVIAPEDIDLLIAAKNELYETYRIFNKALMK